MFSTSTSCRKTAACVVAVMMMMMMMTVTEAAAMLKPGGHSKHPSKTHRKSDGATVETVPLQLDANSLVPSRNIRPLENDSISPWTYNVSHDDSLYPSVLSEAHCLLQGCLDSEGQEDRSLESRPIMHQVLVLRRVRPAGAGQNYHYRLESRLMAVGCTCVRPIVTQQQ
ncbi:interleukin-17F-like [Seriola dumerili]|uniref:Interleukin 17a/f1 n=1 Tax=Seriola dumerili TaxID=41447 RepID=A0A3B4TSZ0_SERDU|nr:interleukin-17F-like [Seriola dumerili]